MLSFYQQHTVHISKFLLLIEKKIRPHNRYLSLKDAIHVE